MATSDDVFQLDAILPTLAQLVFQAATEKLQESWIAVVLDARYSAQDGSFIDKARVEQTDGAATGLSLPVEVVHQLIALGKARPTGPDRWYGILLRVTAEGACEINLNYDSACAEDPSFYAS